jgi:VWFA-related protein
MKRPHARRFTLAICLTALVWPTGFSARAQEPRPTFRSGVSLVPITAVVRDSRSRIVRNLERKDFIVLENSRPRPIVEFRSTDNGPISVALVFDTSGSMRGRKLERGREVVGRLLDQLNVTSDEAALFTFDKRLEIHQAIAEVSSWGQTSVYDSIAASAAQVGTRQAQRRAVVVITDGLDTSSELTLEEVTRVAGSIDVPVYVISVEPPGEEQGETLTKAAAGLGDLAAESGGDLKYVTTPEKTERDIAAILDELRQQYFIAIEAAATSGWHRLDVITFRKGLKVRARGGYMVEDRAGRNSED